MITRILIISVLAIFCGTHTFSQNKNLEKILGERIDGPANIRDTINGNILFSLDNDVKVECTESKNNWQIVGLDALLNATQSKNFKFQKGDTIFDSSGEKVGIITSDIRPRLMNEHKGIETGFITGYTFKGNIKPESIIENALAEIIKRREYNVSLDDLMELISSFGMKTCSPTSMADENGEWYYYSDNLIDDISPRDRITLIIDSGKLLGIVHSHNIDLSKGKTYPLIRGHKFSTIGYLPKDKIDEIIKERVKWYNSVD